RGEQYRFKKSAKLAGYNLFSYPVCSLRRRRGERHCFKKSAKLAGYNLFSYPVCSTAAGGANNTVLKNLQN
ncbi:MAG: hypothetical protein RR463_04105, partial [Hydrogenoanaerobacterium sp.]